MSRVDPDVVHLVAEFWRWFVANEEALRSKSFAMHVVEGLEAHLFALCVVGWEIGPGEHGTWCFCVSPDVGDAECETVMSCLIEAAPVLRQWQFSLYKPARKWELVFEMAVSDGVVEVDGTCWEFVLYAFKDGTYDLLFRPDDVYLELADPVLQRAAEIIVVGEIGEMSYRKLIGSLEVVRTWDERSQRSARRLEVGMLEKMLVRRMRN